MTTVLPTFLFFVLSILILAYLLPAGLAYGYFYHWNWQRWETLKVQKKKTPSRQVIYRDVSWSLISVVVFAVLATILYYLVKNGHGLMYFAIADYGWIYLVFSLLLAFLIHDFYFYWIHRVMHHPLIFSSVHLVHHKTTAPSPWTIYAFQPAEAVLQFSILYLLVFLLPIHPLTLCGFVVYNVVANVGGHCGFEFTPPKNSRHWLLRYLNTVTHHDLHHAECQCNFSQYFNYLDRWMGTFRNKAHQAESCER